ncbi:MAG TPA: DUF4142 domain-containing protein [Polyangiaceae bacterium]|nr:DUF4142 domain-containing protein [Polyangiaceae bacterium]
MFRPTTKTIGLALFALACVQCGGSRTPDVAAAPPPPPPPQAQTDPMAPQQPAMGMAGEPEPGTPPGMQSEPMERQEVAGQDLSDAQITAVTAAANQAEIREAQLAQQKAQSPEVKQFAQMMIRDHTQAQQKQSRLESQLGLAPEQSNLLARLQSDTQSQLQQLQQASGRDFDRTYMQTQMQAHQQLLTAIDQQLLPSVENPELRTQLTQMRATIAHHLERAQAIHSQLESGAGRTPPGQGQSQSQGQSMTPPMPSQRPTGQ